MEQKELNEFLKKFKKFIMERENVYEDEDGTLAVEVYLGGENPEISVEKLEKILESKTPNNILIDCITDYILEYASYNDSLFEDFVEQEELDEETEDILKENRDVFMESYYYHLDSDCFNQKVDVDILIDCGNGNYDYGCDNFSHVSVSGDDALFDEHSSILWLAKQQKKVQELKEAILTEKEGASRFVRSCIEELYNHTYECGTLTFLAKIPLFDLIRIRELQRKEYKPEFKYTPQDNKEAKAYIVLDKSVTCGIFESFHGAGSLFGIELERDVEIPIQFLDIRLAGGKGNTVRNVYGFSRQEWKSVLKEICE